MNSNTSRIAIFAGGCFWCMQPAFDLLEGVKKTTVGYTGGSTKNPTYKEVTSGRTDHVEAIEITYDPSQISYEKLLDIYWHNIDPTVQDRQFSDVGKQYRTVIFYQNLEEKKLAEESKERLLKNIQVYTEILPAKPFYPAEEYHQDYYKKNPIRYKLYRSACKRDRCLKEIWQKD